MRFSRDFPRILSKKPFEKETGKKPQRSIVQPDHSFILKRNMRIISGTDVKLLKKMLYTNEYNALVEAVQDLSGMDDDFDDLKNDAKNE